jgi:ParB family chromosome partitioning protein
LDINWVKIDLIKESTINPRIIFNKVEELKKDFQNRIKEGKIPIMENIGVRPCKDSKYKYEVIWGMQRFLAAKELGIEEIPCIIEEMDDISARIRALKENQLSDPNTWYEEARVYEQLKKKFTWKELEDLIGEPDTQIQRKVYAKRIVDKLCISPKLGERAKFAQQFPLTIWEQISLFPEEYQEEIFEKTKEEKLNHNELRAIYKNFKQMKQYFDILDKKDPMYKHLHSFWWNLKFEKNSYNDMLQEIAIREGTPSMIHEYKPTKTWSEEKAREYAKNRLGEYQGKEEFHIIYCVKNTIEEIRRKYT